MSEHVPKVILIDMLDSIDAISQFTACIDYSEFLANRMVRDAVYRNIEVLGEAANRMPDYFIEQHPEIEWRKLISARNAFIHGYDKINDKIVWNIVQNLPTELKPKLDKLIESI